MSSGGRGTYSITIHVDAAQAQAAITSLTTQLTKVGGSFMTAGSQIGQSAIQFGKFNSEAQRTVGTSSALSGSLGRVSGPLGQLNSQINTTAATLPKLSAAQQQVAAGSQKMGQAMQSNIQRMTAIGSRIGGVAFMFTGLTAAMGEAQGMQSLLAESQNKLTGLQQKATEAVQKYGQGSFQAVRALEAVEKAERAVAFQSRITTLSIQDQFFFIGGLASIALPSVITVIGKLVQAFKTAQAAGQSFGTIMTGAISGIGTKFSAGINAISAGLSRLAPSFIATGAASTAMATNMAANTTVLTSYPAAAGAATTATHALRASLLGLLTNPIVLMIAALVSAFIVLQQNIGGVTDGFRQMGISLGQAVPVLQPFLIALEGIAAQLGITGSASVNAAERFRTAAEGFANIGTLWHDTLAQMQASENELVRFFGNAGVVISDFVVNAGEQFAQFAQSMIVNWDEVIPQIQATLQGLGDWFADFFTRLPGTLSDIAQEMIETLGINDLANLISSNPVLRQMGDAVMSFVDYVQDVSADIITRLGLDKVAAAIQEALQGAALVASGQAPGLGAGAPGTAQKGIQEEPFTGQPGALEFQTEQQKRAAQQRSMETQMGVLHPQVEFLPLSAINPATGKPWQQTGLDINGQPLPAGQKKPIPPGLRPISTGPQTFQQLQQGTGVGMDQFTAGVVGPRQLQESRDFTSRFATPGSKVPGTKGTLPPLFESGVQLKQIRDEAEQTWEAWSNGTDLAKVSQEQFNGALEIAVEDGKLTAEAAEVMKKKHEELSKTTEGEASVLGKLREANKELETSYLQTGEAATSGNLAIEMQRQGMLEAGQAALNYGMELEKNTAFNKVWGEIIDTNAFKQAAFATGVQNQVAELNKQKVALAESVGSLSEYNNQIATGVPQQVAYQQAVVDTGIALNDTDVKIASTQGHIDSMNAALATGRPQQQAYSQGWQEVSLGMQATELEIAGTMGQIDAMNAALQTGVPQAQAYAQGWLAVQQGLQEALVGLAETEGAIASMNAALATGIPQGIAYVQGIQQITQAAQEMQVETANMAGQIVKLNADIASATDTQARFENGLLKGSLAATDMIANMANASGEFLGFRATLEEAANAAGITLPQGLRLSNEAITQLIGLARNSAVALDEWNTRLNEIADSVGERFKPAMEEGMDMDDIIDGAEEKVDEYADHIDEVFGVEIPNSMKEGMQQSGVDEVLTEELQGLGEIVTRELSGPNMGEAAKTMMDSLNEAIKEGGANVDASAQAAMDALMEVIACGGCATAVSEFDAIMQGFGDGMITELASMEERAGAMIDALIAKFGSLGEAVNEAVRLNPELAGLPEGALQTSFERTPVDTARSLGIGQEGITPAAGRGGPDTSQLESIEAKLATVQQALALLGPATAQAVSQMAAAFAALDLTGFTEKLRLGLEPLTLLGPATTQAVAQMSAAFAALDLTGFTERLRLGLEPLTLLGPAAQQAVAQMSAAFASIDLSGFTAALSTALAPLALIGPATQQAVAQMVAAFVAGTNTMITALQGVGNMALQVGTQIQTIGTAAQTAAGTVNAATNTMITALQGVQNMAAQTAQSFAQIGDAANSAAQVVNSATNTMITALQGVISQANAVADAIAAIGDAAASARSEVESLASAINSLQDRTITITVRTVYTSSGGPSLGPGGTPSGAGGIGFYDGVSYLPMAGGSGISGAGFAPIMIDHPTNILVGESGPELVSVTPINRNRNGRTGEISPFSNMSFAHGTGDEGGMGPGTTITTQSVSFDQNQGPIQIIQQGGGGAGTGTGGLGTGGAGSPLGTGGFGSTNIPLGTGQGGTFNVPGGQVSTMGNAVACVNGQCFGNTAGFGAPVTGPGTGGLGGEQTGFQPVRDEQTGAIKAIETLIEWFKFLGLPTGASVAGTGNFTQPGPVVGGTPTGGAFASAGPGAFAGTLNMQGGQIVFDSNQGDMELRTSTGAISIAGQGGAFASAGGAFASAGNVGIFGQQENPQLTQINRSLENVSGSLQAVGNSMASLGEEVVFGNQQAQQTFQGFNTGLQGLQTATQQGFQNVVNGVNLFGAGNQVGFQGFTLPNGQQGGAVGSGGAAGNPLGFLGGVLGGFGINNPFQGAVPSGGTGGGIQPNVGGIGGGATGGTGGCNVCGAATGLQGAATDLSGVANQLGNVMTSGNGVGAAYPNTGGGLPTGGAGSPMGGGGTLPPTGGGGGGGATGGDCDCQCMPMDSDTARRKIEDPSGRDCNNHIYFGPGGDPDADCQSRLNEIHAAAGCDGSPGTPAPNPTPTPTPTPTQQQPGGGMGGVSAFAQGGMAMASANGVTAQAGGTFGGMGMGGMGQPGFGQPIGNPPIPPRIVQSAGLPSQHVDVNQDPDSWMIVESMGLVGTYDIIDDNGDVVMLGFRTLSDAEEYLNYFISYYKWVRSGSNGITGGLGGQGLGGAFASTGGGGGTNISNQIPGMTGTGGIGGIPTGGTGGGGTPTGGTTAPPPTPPPITILDTETETIPTETTADQVEAANVDASTWQISETTRPDGRVVYFVVVTIDGELTFITETPFATRQDAQAYIDYWRQYQLYIANPPTTFNPPTTGGTPTPTVPTTGGVNPMPQMNIGGGGVTAFAGGGGAFAQAGNAIAQAGSFAGAGTGMGQKAIGPRTIAPTPGLLESVPRAQGPFRSGQDNQEPIYDNSGIKIGADFGTPLPLGTTSMEDVEEGPKVKRNRFKDRLERHRATAIAIAGDHPEWVDAFLSAFERMFGDLLINLTVNNSIDGYSVNQSQKKFQVKKVSLYT